MSDQRLYGPPDAEILHFDIDSAIEDASGFMDGEAGQTIVVEEWSVYPPEHHIPDIDWNIVERLTEAWTEEMDEHAYEQVEKLLKAEIPAFEEILRRVASKVTYRMADKKIATHHFAWSDGEWLSTAVVES